LTMFSLFLLFFLGHSLAGYYDYNADQHGCDRSIPKSHVT
jgi:hypothetical protein